MEQSIFKSNNSAYVYCSNPADENCENEGEKLKQPVNKAAFYFIGNSSESPIT